MRGSHGYLYINGAAGGDRLEVTQKGYAASERGIGEVGTWGGYSECAPVPSWQASLLGAGADPHVPGIVCPRSTDSATPQAAEVTTRRSRYGDLPDLCVCCSRGCPSHRHLAGTCVGESQWIGSANDGHAGAAPDRIDRCCANVKRSWCAEEADPFLFASFKGSCQLLVVSSIGKNNGNCGDSSPGSE
jgi:hypothetical protein